METPGSQPRALPRVTALQCLPTAYPLFFLPIHGEKIWSWGQLRGGLSATTTSALRSPRQALSGWSHSQFWQGWAHASVGQAYLCGLPRLAFSPPLSSGTVSI